MIGSERGYPLAKPARKAHAVDRLATRKPKDATIAPPAQASSRPGVPIAARSPCPGGAAAGLAQWTESPIRLQRILWTRRSHHVRGESMPSQL